MKKVSLTACVLHLIKWIKSVLRALSVSLRIKALTAVLSQRFGEVIAKPLTVEESVKDVCGEESAKY